MASTEQDKLQTAVSLQIIISTLLQVQRKVKKRVWVDLGFWYPCDRMCVRENKRGREIMCKRWRKNMYKNRERNCMRKKRELVYEKGERT